MNARDFYTTFKEKMDEAAVDGNGTTYLDLYKGAAKKFTSFINKEIIPVIIQSNGIIASSEYYRVDVVGWRSRSEEEKENAQRVGLNPHLWDLEVAVEHENDDKDWSDEVIKLMHINCPLRVVIGYNDSQERETDLNKLDYIASCIKKMKAYASFSGEMLVILGNCKEQYNEFDYRGYTYRKQTGKFEEIKQEG